MAKIFLTVAFLGVFAIFIGLTVQSGAALDLFRLSVMDLALLAFATLRLGRLIAYDRVMEPLRQFFTETIPDSTGAGETVEPKGQGIQQALGQMICCPICAGTWVAALLTYALYLFPGPARVFLTFTAVIGVVEVLNALVEALSWSGQHARAMSGAISREQQQSEHKDKEPRQKYEFAERSKRLESPENQAAEKTPTSFNEYR